MVHTSYRASRDIAQLINYDASVKIGKGLHLTVKLIIVNSTIVYIKTFTCTCACTYIYVQCHVFPSGTIHQQLTHHYNAVTTNSFPCQQLSHSHDFILPTCAWLCILPDHCKTQRTHPESLNYVLMYMYTKVHLKRVHVLNHIKLISNPCQWWNELLT